MTFTTHYHSSRYKREGVQKKDEVTRPGPTLWPTFINTMVVTGTFIIFFVALSNSITFQLQRIWGASGYFWQNQWEWILDNYGDDPFYHFVLDPFIVGFVVYWVLGSLYTFMDLTGRPNFLRKYKIQVGTNEPVDNLTLLKVLAVVLFNQLMSPLLSAVSIKIFSQFGFQPYKMDRQLPSFTLVLFQILIFLMVEEVGFYYSHRLFHHCFLYKHIHKLHHTWQSPIAITATFCHPIEHIGANLVPVFIGPVLLRCHIITFSLWIALVVASTLNDHSGYHLPLMPSPEFHDYHHLKFNQCYGLFGILDYLHGTDEKFRSTAEYKRHHTTFTLTSPRVSIPDTVKLKEK